MIGLFNYSCILDLCSTESELLAVMQYLSVCNLPLFRLCHWVSDWVSQKAHTTFFPFISWPIFLVCCAFQLCVCASPKGWAASSVPIRPSAPCCPAGSSATRRAAIEKAAAKFHTIFWSALIIKLHGFQKCFYIMLFGIPPKLKCPGRSLLPGFADERVLF